MHGNSPDKLHHTRSVAYSVELVVLNKHLGWRSLCNWHQHQQTQLH